MASKERPKKEAVKEAVTVQVLLSNKSDERLARQRVAPDKRVVKDKVFWIQNTKEKAEAITRHPDMKQLPIALQEGIHILIDLGDNEGMWFELR